MINTIFDKKNAIYSLGLNDKIPYNHTNKVNVKASEIIFVTLNNIFKSLVNNDLYLEQLTLNIKNNVNVPGPLVTKNEETVFDSSEGQKFVLTSNKDPYVQFVRKQIVDVDDTISCIPELSTSYVHFTFNDAVKYYVGTSRGMYCSYDREGPWERVTTDDNLKSSFGNYDCRCFIENNYLGKFNNALDNYGYFLGTNRGVFGLNTVGVNGENYWEKLARTIFADTIVNNLTLDQIKGRLLVETTNGLYECDGTTASLIPKTDGHEIYDSVILESSSFTNSVTNTLIATDVGIMQSTLGYYPDGLRIMKEFGQGIRAIVSNKKKVFICFADNSIVCYLNDNFNNGTTLKESGNPVVTDIYIDSETSIFGYATGTTEIKVSSQGENPDFPSFSDQRIEAPTPITDIVVSGKLIFAAGGNEIYVYNYFDYINEYIEVETLDLPSDILINEICYDGNKSLYVATTNGLYVYEKGEDADKIILVRDPNNLLNENVKSMLIGNGNYVYALAGNNVYESQRDSCDFTLNYNGNGAKELFLDSSNALFGVFDNEIKNINENIVVLEKPSEFSFNIETAVFVENNSSRDLIVACDNGNIYLCNNQNWILQDTLTGYQISGMRYIGDKTLYVFASSTTTGKIFIYEWQKTVSLEEETEEFENISEKHLDSIRTYIPASETNIQYQLLSNENGLSNSNILMTFSDAESNTLSFCFHEPVLDNDEVDQISVRVNAGVFNVVNYATNISSEYSNNSRFIYVGDKVRGLSVASLDGIDIDGITYNLEDASANILDLELKNLSDFNSIKVNDMVDVVRTTSDKTLGYVFAATSNGLKYNKLNNTYIGLNYNLPTINEYNYQYDCFQTSAGIFYYDFEQNAVDLNDQTYADLAQYDVKKIFKLYDKYFAIVSSNNLTSVNYRLLEHVGNYKTEPHHPSLNFLSTEYLSMYALDDIMTEYPIDSGTYIPKELTGDLAEYNFDYLSTLFYTLSGGTMNGLSDTTMWKIIAPSSEIFSEYIEYYNNAGGNNLNQISTINDFLGAYGEYVKTLKIPFSNSDPSVMSNFIDILLDYGNTLSLDLSLIVARSSMFDSYVNGILLSAFTTIGQSEWRMPTEFMSNSLSNSSWNSSFDATVLSNENSSNVVYRVFNGVASYRLNTEGGTSWNVIESLSVDHGVNQSVGHRGNAVYNLNNRIVVVAENGIYYAESTDYLNFLSCVVDSIKKHYVSGYKLYSMSTTSNKIYIVDFSNPDISIVEIDMSSSGKTLNEIFQAKDDNSIYIQWQEEIESIYKIGNWNNQGNYDIEKVVNDFQYPNEIIGLILNNLDDTCPITSADMFGKKTYYAESNFVSSDSVACSYLNTTQGTEPYNNRNDNTACILYVSEGNSIKCQTVDFENYQLPLPNPTKVFSPTFSILQFNMEKTNSSTYEVYLVCGDGKLRYREFSSIDELSSNWSQYTWDGEIAIESNELLTRNLGTGRLQYFFHWSNSTNEEIFKKLATAYGYNEINSIENVNDISKNKGQDSFYYLDSSGKFCEVDSNGLQTVKTGLTSFGKIADVDDLSVYLTNSSNENLTVFSKDNMNVFKGIDELKTAKVNTVCNSDDDMLIWYGSTNGLYRKLRQKVANLSSNAEREITGLSVDHVESLNENYFYSYSKGVVIFDTEVKGDDMFKNYYISSDNKTFGLQEFYAEIKQIGRLNDHEIFFTDNVGLSVYNSEKDHIYDIMTDEFNEFTNNLTLVPLASNNDGSVYVTNEKKLFKFDSYSLKEYFTNPFGIYRNLAKKFRGRPVYALYRIDDLNILIGSEIGAYSFKNNMCLRFSDFVLNQSLTNPVHSFTEVEMELATGYATKYLIPMGSNIFNTINGVTATLECGGLSADGVTINSIYAEGDGRYMIATDHGLYLTDSKYGLDDMLHKYSVLWFKDEAKASLIPYINRHIEEYHDPTLSTANIQSLFLDKLNRKCSAENLEIPTAFTSSTDVNLYNSIKKVENDVVLNVEFNDSNNFIKASIQSWATSQVDNRNVYSDSGYIDQFFDDANGLSVNLADIPYIVKEWNSGMKEFYIYVPSSGTYYINNPLGFSGSLYSGASIPRKNISNSSYKNRNVISERYTKLQIRLNNNHFNLKHIYTIKINNQSLPLKMYKDSEYCQAGRENVFDSVIEPSIVNSLPIVQDQGVNNVNGFLDETNTLKLGFSVYGSDAQAIYIVAD